MGRVLANRYPLGGHLTAYLRDEHSLGRMLDYSVIGSRLQPLYEWSSQELGHPGLRGLIQAGSPVYAWSYEDRHVWQAPPLPLLATALRVATSPRLPPSTRRRPPDSVRAGTGRREAGEG